MTDSPSSDSSAGQPTVWALVDDRPGNNTQVLGVAEALNWQTQEKPVRYTGFARLPNILRRATLAGVSEISRSSFSPPWPDLVIAAGRRSAPVARWIKNQSGGKTRLVQLMFPGRSGAKDFDLIMVPKHDGNKDVQNWSNVLPIVGAPTRINSALLETEAARWRDRFDALPRPYVAFIVGGAIKNRKVSPQRADILGKQVAAVAKASGGSVLLTTSRRTGYDVEQVLLAAIPEPRSDFLWGDEGENPYFGYLALADAIVVTGDSITMCAEACATESPVYIAESMGPVSPKHARFHQELYDHGYARPLSDTEGGVLTDWSHAPLTPATEVAESVKRLLASQPIKG